MSIEEINEKVKNFLVEDQFGYKMKPEDFKELHTLDQFCKFIQDHIA